MYLAMMLFGFGWFTTSPLTSGCVGDYFGDVRMGTIIGVTMSCHTVGMAIGAYAGGLTYTLTGSYLRFFLAGTSGSGHGLRHQGPAGNPGTMLKIMLKHYCKLTLLII